MRALVPSETALVLGGGGAKGAYEVGAIAALDELGIKAGSVFGTSRCMRPCMRREAWTRQQRFGITSA